MRKNFSAFLMVLVLVILSGSFGTAHAWIKTVTFTFTDMKYYYDSNGAEKHEAYVTATGDINANYTVDITNAFGHNAFSWTMGDLSFNGASNTTNFSFGKLWVNTYDFGFAGAEALKDWTLTISNNNNYYINNVVYYKINNATIEQDNDSNICSITTSN